MPFSLSSRTVNLGIAPGSTGLNHDFNKCVKNVESICSYQLASNQLMRYQVNAPPMLSRIHKKVARVSMNELWKR